MRRGQRAGAAADVEHLLAWPKSLLDQEAPSAASPPSSFTIGHRAANDQSCPAAGRQVLEDAGIVLTLY